MKQGRLMRREEAEGAGTKRLNHKKWQKRRHHQFKGEVKQPHPAANAEAEMEDDAADAPILSSDSQCTVINTGPEHNRGLTERLAQAVRS